MNPKHCLIALWCLLFTVGCARVTEEAPKVAPPAAEAATDPVPPATVSQVPVAVSVGASTPGASASPAPAPPPEESTDDPSTATEAQQPSPSAATAEPSSPVVEQPVIAAAAAPAEAEREQGFAHVAPSVAPSASADALDLASLLTRLRKTKAISLRTKLAVKNESDDLFERFRAYHAEHGTATLAELRRSYDELLGRLCALLEDADPPLARDIDRSRAAIWAVLADPIEFGAARPNASERRVPQA